MNQGSTRGARNSLWIPPKIFPFDPFLSPRFLSDKKKRNQLSAPFFSSLQFFVSFWQFLYIQYDSYKGIEYICIEHSPFAVRIKRIEPLRVDASISHLCILWRTQSSVKVKQTRLIAICSPRIKTTHFIDWTINFFFSPLIAWLLSYKNSKPSSGQTKKKSRRANLLRNLILVFINFFLFCLNKI